MKLENAPESTQLNFTLNRVKEILGYDNDEKVSNVSDSNTKITDILKVSKNKRNVELAAYLIWEVDSQWFKSFDIKNKELALIGIKASSDNFKHIDKN